MIDFAKIQTELLLNPRLSDADIASAKNMLFSRQAPDGLVWLLTSGSSGYQKLVGLSRDALLESAAAVNRHLESVASDKWLLALPKFHVGGLSIYARAHLSGGAVLAPFKDGKWSAKKFLDMAANDKCTLSALVPTQVFDLVGLNEECPGNLRAIVVGGGVIDPALYERARALGYPLLPSYGLTECCSQVATASLKSLELDQYPSALCLDHVEVAAPETGKLRIKSRALFSGYLYSEEEKTVFDDPKKNGWFETDDRGKVAGRELMVFGRDSKFLKISGENVDLNRLEKCLENLRAEHMEDFDAALVVKPDERVGYSLILVIEKDAGTQLATTLKDIFNSSVMPFERVRGIAYVDTIPRSEMNKLQRIDPSDLDVD